MIIPICSTVVGVVVLLMIADKRIRLCDFFKLFWYAFKNEPPNVLGWDADSGNLHTGIAPVDWIHDPVDWIHDQDTLDRYYVQHNYEKVNWKEEGF